MTTAPTRIYRLLKSALPEAERIFRRSYLPAILILATGALLASLLLGIRSGSSLRSSVAFALIFAILLTYMAFSIPRRASRTIRKMWDTYELEVGPDFLLRRQADLTDLRLRFDEVSRVEHRLVQDAQLLQQKHSGWEKTTHPSQSSSCRHIPML